MPMLTSILSALLAAPVAVHAPQDKPQLFDFARPRAKALQMVAKEIHDLKLTSLQTQFGDGEPRPQEVAMQLLTRVDAAIADEALPLEGVEGALRRRFLALEGSIQVMDPASFNAEDETFSGVKIDLQSPLLAKSVAFVPAASQPDGYGRHFDAEALREAALPKLSAPRSWDVFLPPAAENGERLAILGDEWDLQPADLELLLAPTGFLGWRTPPKSKTEAKTPEDSNAQVLRAFSGGVGGNLQLAFDGQVTGTAKARLLTVGVDPDNGRFGGIEIRYDLSFRADREEFLESRRLEEAGELDLEILGGDLQLRLSGVATVNWGLDLGRPFSALANAEETVTMSVRVMPESGDVVTQTMAMSGTLLNGLTFKEVPVAPVKRTVVPTSK